MIPQPGRPFHITPQSYKLFSGGEVHLTINNIEDWAKEDSVVFAMRDFSMNGFMALCQAKDILQHLGQHLSVVYPYFPYARQDRYTDTKSPFSLKTFCQMLNSQNFDSIGVWDPHSDVTPALLDRCVIVAQEQLVQMTVPEDVLKNFTLISPDAGAFKKISRVTQQIPVICTKTRDPNGNIMSTTVLTNKDLRDTQCLIIDDICDGGRTFMEIAKCLREDHHVQSVCLYVTHGIFSRGVGVMKDLIDLVYTTNSLPQTDHPLLSVKEILV